jgi:hypothetical protein
MHRALLLLACLPICAGANPGDRARLASERQVILDRYDIQEQACQGRFAVTACVEEVRARRREALAPLRESELRLTEAERRVRADERRAAVAAKQQAMSARAAPPAEPQLHPRLPPGPVASAPRIERRRGDEAARAEEAARRAQAADRRRGEAQAEQARVTQRLADRAQRGSKTDPLPSPGAASVPQR